MTFCKRAIFVLLILGKAGAASDPAALRDDPGIKAAFAAIVRNASDECAGGQQVFRGVNRDCGEAAR